MHFVPFCFNYQCTVMLIWSLVKTSKFSWSGGLLRVGKSLTWNYWPSITLNFGPLIKRKWFIQSLYQTWRIQMEPYVLQKKIILMENVLQMWEYVFIGLCYFFKSNFLAFTLPVLWWDVARCQTSRPRKGLQDICFSRPRTAQREKFAPERVFWFKPNFESLTAPRVLKLE